MKKRESKRKQKRTLAFCLAVLLWTEGTLGSVFAAQETTADNAEISVSAGEGLSASDGAQKLDEDGTPVSDGMETPVPAGNESPTQEEEKTPIESENPAPGEEEKPAEGEKPVPGEDGTPAGSENPASGEEEKPAEGGKPVPGEEEKPAKGEESVLDETEETARESVSGNAANTEEDFLPEQIPGAGEALGEPPLLPENGASMGMMSYGDGVMSTEEQSISLQTPGTVDIIARYKAYPWKLDTTNTYSDQPSAKSPYKAGYLSDESLNNTLNLMNFIRYVAGIPANVTLDGEYTELAQAGALVNCVNKKLTHTPEQPQGFPDALYEKGKEGCGSSNIAYNYGNMAKSLLNGWMYDGDDSNIVAMGHRRWVLNPSMQQTGFGAVGAYSAMYVFDRKGSSITDYVAWPAQNMPVELMNGSGTPWTLSLGSDYQRAEQQQIKVTLKNVSSGKIWTFSEKKADGYFAVNTKGFGMPNCIIFRPNSFSYDETSQFQVTVTGLKDKDGNAATVSYNVDFFSLSDTPKEVESVSLNAEKLHLLLNDTKGKNQGALHAVLTPSNAADKTLTWASLNTAVATVDDNGVVTAKNVGETTVTVTAGNGMQAACAVKVSHYALAGEGITAAPDPADESGVIYRMECELPEAPQGNVKKILVLDGGTPAADQIKWTGENENVVKVDADGVVTPVGVGTATIWADIDNGLVIFSCEVTVTNAELPTMQMWESSVTMNVQEERQLRVYLSPAGTKWENGGGKYIKWKSSDPGKAVFWCRQENGGMWSEEEVIGGNTVTLLALAAGTTTITAEIVDEAGNPAEGIDAAQGRGTASCEVTVQRAAVLPAQADRPCLLALTNTQSTLQEVELPEGWNWKYPDTSLAQFAGQRSKTFPAEYRLAENGQPSEEIQPAEALLPVYFLTLEKISMCVKHSDNDSVPSEVSVLKPGWVSHCYVNYSFEDTLAQFEEKNAELKNNIWYQNNKTGLLKQLDKAITLTSSKPEVVRVEPVKNAEGKTRLTAVALGNAELKAELKLGKKTFRASQKLTVAEHVGAAFEVKGLDIFGKTGGEDSYRYAANLSDFPMAAQGGINSKIRLEMTGVTKLTVKSSNSKVVALKSSTVKPTGTVQFEFPLMVKAAGTAEITVTGDDAAKTSHTLTLVVADARPGLSEETVTVNTWRTAGTDFCLYAGKDETDHFYNITDVSLEDVDKTGTNSQRFNLKGEGAADGSRWNCNITAKADTRTGTYKMQLYVRVGENKAYRLPLTVKVVSTKPKCSVKQKDKLNLFYQDTKSPVIIDTEEEIESVGLTGCNYLVEQSDSEEGYGYYLMPGVGATLNSVKKGNLKIVLKGYKPLEMPFTVKVEKKAIRMSPVAGSVTLYPNSGLTSAGISIKDAEKLPWNDLRIEGFSVAGAKGNYEAKLQQEAKAVLLQGRNLNRAESVRITIQLRSNEWTQPADLICNVKVNMGQPAIALEKKTLQLNANDAYKGYDAVSTAVRWKNGTDVLATQNVRVSVYSDPKDVRARAVVADGGVIFSVEKNGGRYLVKARLNNKTVAQGSYKFIVQAAKDGKIWKTPLTLKVVNTAPDKAVKIAAKGSIDVLDREGSFLTLTPSLKAVNGTFVIPDNLDDREVELTGQDAHLFQAGWSADGKTIELRAKENVALVIKYNYTVTPVLSIRNVNGVTEKIRTAPVRFKVKQGSVKVGAAPKTTLMYSNTYSSVTIDMKADLKGAAAPKIENVTLVTNTDAFTYVYNNEGKGTLTMKRTGHAVKGKRYSLQFRVTFAEQADNVKPVTVKYPVIVK